jgi:FkbM family methyltransferase
MKGYFQLKLASLIFHHAYFLYEPLYFSYKNKKDSKSLALIKKFLKPGSTILDIGSNIGFYAVFLSEVVGSSGHVYCFEPDVTNFKHLKNTLRNKSNVTVIQKAVADTSGIIKLYPSPLLNVDHRTYSSQNSNVTYEVEKISIDDYVNGKFKIDFIKMDIQGFETEALMGMRKTLSENNDILLLMEFWPYGLHQAGSSSETLYKLVVENGFNIYRIDEKGLTPFTLEEAMSMKVEYYTDCNVLLTRKVL